MTDSLPEAQSKSGLILKAAREEMSLSLEHVANELHLRPAVVKAIEDENYDEFSSDVFLKGYFRTYCRLVNLHESRMMELLDQQLLLRQTQAENIKRQALKEIQSKKRKKLIITFVVFIVLSSLILFAYQLSSNYSFDSHPQPISKDSQDNIIEDGASPSVNEVIGADSANIDDTVTQDLDQSILKVDDESHAQISTLKVDDNLADKIVESNETLESYAVENASTEADPIIASTGIQTEETNIILDETQISEEPPLSAAVDSNISTLIASFTGDCWFKVTDSRGKAVIAALKKADDQINYEGSAPFHIVIGDASTVTLIFQGEQIDLKPFTSRNGRAELTLTPSETNNEG